MTVLADVHLEALPRYLATAQGWEPVRENARREIWQYRTGDRVFVPRLPGSDLARLVEAAAQQIATSEQRSIEDVGFDLVFYRYDRVQVRRTGAAQGLAFNDGLEFHQGLYDLVLAAAQAARERRRDHASGRRPTEVGAYLDRVRLIPSVVGSFVARALLPLELGDDVGDEPFPTSMPVAADARAVSEMLVTATSAAVDSAHAIVADEADLSAWDRAVDKGVNARLCDAMTRMIGEEEPSAVDLDVRWTWVAPAVRHEPLRIPADLAPTIAAGRDYLRHQPESERIVIVGLVTKLHRELKVGRGEVTVKGHIQDRGGSARPLRLELDEQTYDEAIRAHKEGRSVRVAATVDQEPGRPMVTRQVHSLRVLSDND